MKLVKAGRDGFTYTLTYEALEAKCFSYWSYEKAQPSKHYFEDSIVAQCAGLVSPGFGS